MTVDELLSSYREVFAVSEFEKGERFERTHAEFLADVSCMARKNFRRVALEEFSV